MSISTPRGNRTHIAIFGRRNAGKSTLLNAVTGQAVSLVSDVPGTTTDPVSKPMEMPGIGPAVLIDTAGTDDEGVLGEMRVRRTRQVMDKTDLALVVVRAGQTDLEEERTLVRELSGRGIPVIVVANRMEGGSGAEREAVGNEAEAARLSGAFRQPVCIVNALRRTGIPRLLRMIAERASRGKDGDFLLDGLAVPGDVVVLVMPQDKQAPKGRLILPQVQVIRELLDRKALAIAVTDEELPQALAALRRKPDLVITDSQVFGKVSQMLDEDVPLSSFSILFARNKGDAAVFREGAEAIDDLRPGDKVLIAEACTHHPVKGDISREKLPNWLMERAGGPLSIHVQAGNDFPEDLSGYRLIIHCGACMTNRKQVLSRISRAKEAGVPITNHGMAIAKMTGILDRAMGPLESMRL
jgi:[FeFe] hydrogenase H-cluster maturation GTPase HydF